jgi:hypothetical protein
VIGNYRIDALPVAVRKAIRADYEHLTGDYRLGLEYAIRIDDQVVLPGSAVHLKAGPHVSNVVGYKLRLIPPKKILDSLDLRYRMPSDLFPAIYDY